MKAKKAKKCFNKILKLYSDPKAHPEQYYLCLGLANLAASVSDLRSELKTIRRNVTLIQRKLLRQK
jgi:hypothetical protein